MHWTGQLTRRSTAALAGVLLLASTASSMSAGETSRAVDEARKRWADSPHGPMLERILPPTFDVAQLPQRGSPGADLVVRYCVQCHNLPNPAMHHAEKWPRIVDRMVVRMRGKGNMGTLMQDMMAGVTAPTDEEVKVLLDYLRRNSQRPIDAAKYPELEKPAGQSFRLACQQCHTLPDPKRHTAKEWPGVVARMEKNMLWMNRVVGSKADPREPQLRTDEIVSFLKRNARAN